MIMLGMRVRGTVLGAVLLAFGAILPFFVFGNNFSSVQAYA